MASLLNFISVLNNREIAAAIWLLIFFIFVLLSSSIRRHIPGVLKAFFHKKIIIPFLIMLIYVLIMVIVFKKVGFWDISATKDTILWTIGTAFATFFNLPKVAGDESYFKNTILHNIKLVVIFEFVVNLYSFGLIVEFIMWFFVGFVVMVETYAEAQPKYKSLKTLFDVILFLWVCVLIVFTFQRIVLDFHNFATLRTLRNFSLPPVFSILLFPFIYGMALYISYDSLFIRIDFANKHSDLARYAKRRVLATCRINLPKLNKLSKNAGFPEFSSENDILDLIKEVENK